MSELEDRLLAYGDRLSVAADHAMESRQSGWSASASRTAVAQMSTSDDVVAGSSSQRVRVAIALAGATAVAAVSLVARPQPVGIAGNDRNIETQLTQRLAQLSAEADQQVFRAEITSGVGFTLLDVRWPLGRGSDVASPVVRSDGNTAVLPVQAGISVLSMTDGIVDRVGNDELGMLVETVDTAGNRVVYRGLRDVYVVEGQRTLGRRLIGDAQGPTLRIEVLDATGVTIDTAELLRVVLEASPAIRSVLAADGTRITVAADYAERLLGLINAAKRDGIMLSGSGYRSPYEQLGLRRAQCGESLYEIYLAPASSCSPPTARLGGSPHLRGLAVDFTSGGRMVTKRSPAHRWLTTNARRFGLSSMPSEPWHWEWRSSSQLRR